MKPNTQKLLFFLYTDNHFFSAGYPLLQQVLPDMTYSGLRSVISLLAQQNLIEINTQSQGSQIWITQTGREALRPFFPALFFSQQQWQGQWTALVFLEAPPGDKQFRYLRTQAIKVGGLPLTRGTYLFPGDLPESLKEECKGRYAKQVASFGISDWQVGDIQLWASRYYSLIDLTNGYSGISTEISQLISKNKPFITLKGQEKKHIFSLFDRLCHLTQDDRGLTNYYFPQVPTPSHLLRLLHQLLS